MAAAFVATLALASPAAGQTPYQESTISTLSGGSVSLALDAQGNPHVAWCDDVGRNLMYAVRTGGRLDG